MRRKPTRRDLLVIIGRLQVLVGQAAMAYGNDRGTDRATQVFEPLREAENLCIAARGQDPPIDPSGPWAKNRFL